MKILFTLLLSICIQQINCQTVKTTIFDNKNNSLIGIKVTEKFTDNSTVSNLNGFIQLKVKNQYAVLVFEGVGVELIELDARAVKDTTILKVIEAVNTIQTFTGSRNTRRSSANSLSAVDVLNVNESSIPQGINNLQDLLHYILPSYNSLHQSGSDFADHFNGSSFRGASPDQILILINGKKYHYNSFLNTYGTIGRGNTTVDINTIPLTAIEKVEVLKDGASAQYGSDAIAGVINIVLKKTADKIIINAQQGAFNTSYNKDGKSFDGLNYNYSLTYGKALKNNGFVNIMINRRVQDFTNRAGYFKENFIKRREFGDANTANNSIVLNAQIPLSQKSTIYSSMIANFRNTSSYEYTRYKEDIRNLQSVYPNGYDPILNSFTHDLHGSLGFKYKINKNSSIDISNTLNVNGISLNVHNSLNTGIGTSSPRSFFCGDLVFKMYNANVDYTHYFEKVLKGMNIAIGGEFRHEDFEMGEGETGSYISYDAGKTIGSQGYTGIAPGNRTDSHRQIFGGYADVELDIIKQISTSAAIRFENYSDLGAALNGKFSTRFNLHKNFGIRGTISTGYRAPSLAQINYSQIVTHFAEGELYEGQISKSNGIFAKKLKIEDLKQETSRSIGAGIIAKFGNFDITSDFYEIIVQDKVLLTGAFTQEDSIIGEYLKYHNVKNMQTFTNAIDTRTIGLDINASYKFDLSNHKFKLMFGFNYNKLDIVNFSINDSLSIYKDVILNEREATFIKNAAPQTKSFLSLNYNFKALNITLRGTEFGSMTMMIDKDDFDSYELESFGAKTVFDAQAGFKLKNGLSMTAGVNNIFDTYPKISKNVLLNESGGFTDVVQMGIGGRNLFLKLNFVINTKK